MSRLSTVAMLITVVLLVGAYLFPIWQIRLEAPQYPQGLGLDIWIDKITGAERHDLQNINGLNHYIGMKVIEPDAIPELRFMKWVLAALIALGAIVAVVRKKALLGAWVVVAIALSIAGMYDFYRWEYDYGHNLDPSAAIKIPGMTYQPPMFGTKQLLNFRTTAWPGLGGLCAMIAVGLATLAFLGELTRGKRRGAALAALLVFGPVALGSCSKGPRPIEYGVDGCDHCRMTISDDRYGAEIVTDKGRAYKYDSIECMVRALPAGAESKVLFHYVTDFSNHGVLIDAAGATYLRSASLPSPMGMNLTAFADREAAARLRSERGGDLLDWSETVALVTRSGE